MNYVQAILKGGFTINKKTLMIKLGISFAMNGALNLLKLVKSVIETNSIYRITSVSLLQEKSFHIKCDILRL